MLVIINKKILFTVLSLIIYEKNGFAEVSKNVIRCKS